MIYNVYEWSPIYEGAILQASCRSRETAEKYVKYLMSKVINPSTHDYWVKEIYEDEDVIKIMNTGKNKH